LEEAKSSERKAGVKEERKGEAVWQERGLQEKSISMQYAEGFSQN